MRRSMLVAAGCASGMALLLTAAAGGGVQATKVQLTAALDAAQEVPRPTGNVGSARGKFTATATASGTGAVVSWKLTFSGTTGAVAAAHIHIGARGRAGPVAVPLCGPCQSRAGGQENVDAAARAAILAGRAYVNVHTAANADGEIRGQIGVLARVRAALNARQEVPKPKGAVGRARGVFTVTVTKSGSTASVTWKLTFSRLTGRAAAAHIHVGARGKAGPVAVALCGPCRSGVSGRTNLKASVLKALEAGRAYVNVHTAKNPAGEIRGQIAALALSLTGGSGGGGGGGGDPIPPPPPPYP